MKPKYIVINGMAGSEHSVQFHMLEQLYSSDSVVFVREPELPRDLFEDASQSQYSIASLMFYADIVLHLRTVVMPALAAGKHVISNGGGFSTFAFACYGEGRDDLAFSMYTYRKEFAKAGLALPDAYLIYDLDAQLAYSRVAQHGAEDIFDAKPYDYHARVRTGFRHFKATAELDGITKVHFVDAEGTIDDVHEETNELIAEILGSISSRVVDPDVIPRSGFTLDESEPLI